jgi:putative ABC transport system permease protein
MSTSSSNLRESGMHAPEPLRPPSIWALAWRMLWRDLRAGEWRLLVLAVALAVAALGGVAMFGDRLQAGLQRDAAALLGGDAVVVSDHPVPASLSERARRLGLATAQTATLPTMARAAAAPGASPRLVALKAVGAGYPLRGALELRRAEGGVGQTVREGPSPGRAWVDAGVLDALDLRLGDALALGELELTVSGVLVREPDRGAGFLNFAPRVLIHEADLARSGLIQPASRVTYRLAVAGRPEAVRAFVQAVEAELRQPAGRGMRLETLENGRPEMRQTFDRSTKFLKLVALLTALLSAIAVALAARDFARRHLDDCALLRVFGLRQRTIAAAYGLAFGIGGVVASAIGLLAGYGVQAVLVGQLGGLLQADLPAAGPAPWWFGLGVGLTLLVSFGLPPVLQLARVPPLRVLRRDLGELQPLSVSVAVLGILGFAALLLAASADGALGLYAVGGFAGAALFFAALALAALALLRRVVREGLTPPWLTLATRRMTARPAATALQVSSLALGLLALSLLVLLRTDLIDSWRKATPAHAPDRFVINILPDQQAAFQEVLRTAGVTGYDWYPMIRGRLVGVNDRTVAATDYADERAQRLVDREFNLSYTAQAPEHNRIVAGRWQPNEPNAISVEQGLAETLGLKLNDVLRFDMAGVEVQARITSLRQVDWGSMRANFFVIFPIDRLDAPVAQSYLAAFRSPPVAGFDARLTRAFPNVTVVDLSTTLAEVQRVIEQIVRAIEFLFAWALAAGLLVLFAAVTAARQEHVRAFAILRALGARQRFLARVQGAELLGVGLLAGTLAGACAWLIGWALARRVFGFDWTAPLWVPLVTAVAGAALAWAAGWLGLRGVLRRPVVETLRAATVDG